MYSSLYLKKQKYIFPHVLIVGFCFCLILLLIFFYKKTVNIHQTKVEKNITKTSIIISNVTSYGATIIWETALKQKAELELFNRNKSLGIFFDDRDVQNQIKERRYHYVTVKNLSPSTEYTVQVKNGSVLQRRNFVTKFKTKTIEKPLLAYGVIEKKYKEQNIIVLSFENYYPVSILSSINGEWILSYHLMVPKSINIQPISNSSIGKLTIFFEESDPEIYTLTYKQFDEKYSLFSQLKKKGEVAGLLISEKADDGLKIGDSNQKDIYKSDLTIISPIDGAMLDGTKPLFKGVAKPGQKLRFKIEPSLGNVYDAYADSKGLWTYVPYFGLENGTYTFSVTVYNDDGTQISKSRKFTIVKSGQQVLGEATRSATITVTPTLVISDSPTNIMNPIEPTQPAISTQTPEVTKIFSSPKPIQTITISQQEPISGFDAGVYMIMSGFLIAIGSFLFLAL